MLGKQNKKTDSVICSSIHADAKIKTSILYVGNVLDGIGKVTLAKNKEKLKCVISNGLNSKQTLILNNNEIIFISYSNVLDLKTRAYDIIKFLLILGVLSEFYDISICSFYKQIIEILRDITKHMYASVSKETNQARSTEIIENLSRSNEVLSHNMIDVLNSKNELKENFRYFKDFSFAILAALSKNGHDIEKVLAKEFDIQEDIINRIEVIWNAENKAKT